MGLISISELSVRAHICSVYQLVEVAVCHLHLTAPPLIDLACWSLPCLSLAPPSRSPGGLSGPFYIGIHITLKRSPPCRLSLTAPPIVLVCWLPLCLPPVRPSPPLEGLCRPLMPLLCGDQ